MASKGIFVHAPRRQHITESLSVGANIDAYLFFANAQHNLTVVGQMDPYIKPIYKTYILVSPGQTMDVLLETDLVIRGYYMAGRHFSSEYAKVSEFDHVIVTAMLEHSGNYTVLIQHLPSFPRTFWCTRTFAAALNFTYQIKSLAPRLTKNVKFEFFCSRHRSNHFCTKA